MQAVSKLSKNRVLWVIFLGILLAACRPERESPPSILDRNETIIAIQNQRVLSATPPTPSPAPTRVAATPTATRVIISVPTPTGTPPIDRTDYVRQTVKPGAWKTSYFTALDGTRLTLKDFEGRVVVVQTLSTLCTACQEQSSDLRLAAQGLDEFGNADNVVFINVSVDPMDTLDHLKDYQAAYGMDSTPTITWITGLASQDFLRDVRDAFGERYIDPNAGEVFFVDPFGYGQISDAGFMVANRLRDVIINLLTTDVVPTEEATEPPAATSEP